MSISMDLLARAKAKGLDPTAFLKKAHCGADEHASAVGKLSETPTLHSLTPLMKTEVKDEEAGAAPDPNRPGQKDSKKETGAMPPSPMAGEQGDSKAQEAAETPEQEAEEHETKEAFMKKAKTLTTAMFALKQAGLLRPDLLKLAADALEVTPMYMDINSSDGVIAAGYKEDAPQVAEKIKQASEKLNEKILDRVVERLASYYFEG